MIEELILSTDYVVGLTSSIDPLIVSDETDTDRVKKSIDGLKQLMSYKGIIKDLVAEITVDNRNVIYLYQLVKTLTDFGINSDITVIDIAKSPYYDFSNVTDPNLLVGPSDEIKREFDKILEDDSLDIHMKRFLLPEILKILPSELDCDIPEHPHNMTIDADGSIRLCLRIRGVKTPENLNIKNIFDEKGKLTSFYRAYTKIDKQRYCRKCNWTCILMSNKINKDDDTKDLIHLDKREELKHGR
jgi:radical SAM protein with 4Fe4S-binding SPASM domain